MCLTERRVSTKDRYSQAHRNSKKTHIEEESVLFVFFRAVSGPWKKYFTVNVSKVVALEGSVAA